MINSYILENQNIKYSKVIVIVYVMLVNQYF